MNTEETNQEENNQEDTELKQPLPRWIIDLDWFPQSNRSFAIVARSCLCSGCRKQLGEKPEEIPTADLMATIRDCCSKQPAFITSELPVMASIFRLLLANENQPLDTEELSRRLTEWRRGYPISPESLIRLLENDRYYGISRVAE